MTSETQPNQADGPGQNPIPGTAESGGESQGGAYPNPHSGKDGDGFDGGQSGRSYHGPGQLGEETPGSNGGRVGQGGQDSSGERKD